MGDVSQTASRAFAIVQQLLFSQAESIQSILGQPAEELRLGHAGCCAAAPDDSCPISYKFTDAAKRTRDANSSGSP